MVFRAPRSRLQVSILGPLRYERNTLPLRQVAITVLPNSQYGTRTRAARVKGEYPNHLD